MSATRWCQWEQLWIESEWTAGPTEQLIDAGHQYHGTTLMRTIILYPNYCADSTHHRADSRFAPSQWETALFCNDISHWLGASLESALYQIVFMHNLNSTWKLLYWPIQDHYHALIIRQTNRKCLQLHGKFNIAFWTILQKLCLENWVHTCTHTYIQIHQYRALWD